MGWTDALFRSPQDEPVLPKQRIGCVRRVRGGLIIRGGCISFANVLLEIQCRAEREDANHGDPSGEGFSGRVFRHFTLLLMAPNKKTTPIGGRCGESRYNPYKPPWCAAQDLSENAVKILRTGFQPY